MFALNQTEITFFQISFDFSKKRSENALSAFVSAYNIKYNKTMKQNQPQKQKNPQACDLKIVSKEVFYMQILCICYDCVLSAKNKKLLRK